MSLKDKVGKVRRKSKNRVILIVILMVVLAVMFYFWKAARLWLAGLFLNIGLAVWVMLTIPAFNQVSLGFAPSGAALPPSPAGQLILLPIESAFLWLTGLFAGMYFYRWPTHRILAMIIWGSSALTSLLFLLAVLFIVSTPI